MSNNRPNKNNRIEGLEYIILSGALTDNIIALQGYTQEEIKKAKENIEKLPAEEKQKWHQMRVNSAKLIICLRDSKRHPLDNICPTPDEIKEASEQLEEGNKNSTFDPARIKKAQELIQLNLPICLADPIIEQEKFSISELYEAKKLLDQMPKLSNTPGTFYNQKGDAKNTSLGKLPLHDDTQSRCVIA